MRSYLIMLLLAIVFTHATAAANGSMRLQKRVAKVMQTAVLWAGVPLLCSGIGCSLAVHEPAVAVHEPAVAEQAGDVGDEITVIDSSGYLETYVVGSFPTISSAYQGKFVHYMVGSESFVGVAHPFHGVEPTMITVGHGNEGILSISYLHLIDFAHRHNLLDLYAVFLWGEALVDNRVIDISQAAVMVVPQEPRRLDEKVAFPAAAVQIVNSFGRDAFVENFSKAEVLYGKTVAFFSDGYRLVRVTGVKYRDGIFLPQYIVMFVVHENDLRRGGTAEQQLAVSFDPDGF